MKFSLYNTLSRQKELFEPLRPGKVDFYACGPTVYNVVHVGNLRSFVCEDLVFRFLKFGLGYEVRWVMNITDVDDKTIRDSQKKYPNLPAMEALQRFTRSYEELFFEDLEQLNIARKSFFQTPRATESIPEMQELIRKIHQNGYAYVKDGSIYFAVDRYAAAERYGQLVSIDPTALQSGRRTLADEIEKENVQDFVLWKAQKEGEPSWDFDFFGQNLPGRPGWHIECSAMEKAAFGELPFDIHAGGVDLQFPHHEDEIAQSIAGYGVAPTRFWIHNEHLMIDGQKMSKSLGNFYTLADLLQKGSTADELRFFFVTNHYRTKLNLTEEALQAAAIGLQKIRNALRFLPRETSKDSAAPERNELPRKFLEALADDLSTPQAVAILYESLPLLEKGDEASALFLLAEAVFGVRLFPEAVAIPVEIVDLANARIQAKAQKDYKMADRLRQEILAKGYEVRDTADSFELLPLKL